MKPLLQRRTFWKGFVAGAVSLAVLVMAVVITIDMMTPREVYRLRATGSPRVVYEPYKTPELIAYPGCDIRGKDCVVFDVPEKDVVRTVSEPGTLLLLCVSVIVIPLVKRLTRKSMAV